MSRRLSLVVLALLTWSATRASAWPDFSGPQWTLRQHAAESNFVVLATVAKRASDSAGPELRIEMVVKPGAGLKDEKVITLRDRLAVPDGLPTPYLAFVKVSMGELVPVVAGALESDAAAKYLRDALKLDPKKPGDAAAFFYRYLESPARGVREDVYFELAFMKYADLREGAARLSPDAIAASLGKPDRLSIFRELDALLLGHCGKERHAEMLKKQIDLVSKSGGSELHALLSGYALLSPKEGLTVMRDLIKQEIASFPVRHGVLRALRFFATDRPDVFPRGEIVQALGLLLDHADIADLGIEELRRLGEDSVMDRVLALPGRKGFDRADNLPRLRRAVLRYMLRFPKNTKARAYVEQRRATDPEAVESAQELLKQVADAKKGE